MITRKYEFTNEAAADAAIDLLRDEEGNLTEAVVKLGYLTTTPATYDEEGNELTPAIVSDVYAVDVNWKDVPNQEWQQYLVWPTPMGIHSFGSSSARDEYALAYCILYPNSTYCNPPDEEELYTE
jgi:hypothetical protein